MYSLSLKTPMRSSCFISVVFLTIGICYGISSEAATTSDANVTKYSKKQAFLVYCASCHGRSGKGDGGMVRFLRTEPADLTTLTIQNNGIFPYDRVREVIDGRKMIASHGVREMPIWGNRFRTEAPEDGNFLPIERQVKNRITDLVEYLISIQAN